MLTPWFDCCLLSILLLSTGSHARNFQSGPLHHRQHKGQVYGINTRDEKGNLYLRREVRDLHKSYPDQWSLYLLALEKLQWENEDDPYSYFGLAGIHGRPYRTWEDAHGITEKIGTTGYCPHNNQLFLGWHRPYLALFEQVLHQHMLEIAWTAPSDQVDRYVAAVEAFRMPYWDWTFGDSVIPWFFKTETITITKPDGYEETIWNPLYTYRFKQIPVDEFDDKWRHMNQTVRWPVSDDPWAASQQDQFQQSYIEQSPSIVTEMGMVFRSSSFQRFASRVEEPHGWIHGVIGGGWDSQHGFKGHFWPLEYSAFEPLFMLHHTNVDRLMAMYQAAHPDRWMEPANVGDKGNVFIEDYSIVDADTALLPFRKHTGDFWTSNDCRDHTVFGYTYPELQRWKYSSEDKFQSAITGYISTTYDASVRSLLAAQQQGMAGSPSLITNDGTFVDWTIETSVIASAALQTFIAQFTLTVNGSNIHVGKWMVLLPSNKRHRVQSSLVTRRISTTEHDLTGTVSLTTHLIHQVGAGLRSLEPRDVVPFLKDHLSWEIHTDNGTLFTQEQFRVFNFEVFSTKARIPDDINKPIEYDQNATAHPEVTRGKSGGVTI